ncbi:hypothetical protein OIU74_027020 [Salix koriyanagi]|uniref:Uncharacterized protein n=1 Tax=Salix koriyanagi TaxID=2511006 RepID=A0A9Q0W2I3_9ROSI|nr:hypothetical protein OIU74_027020 [Salix koriyanagi]
MALHVRHVNQASNLQAQAADTAAGTLATMWGALGLPHLSTSSANECHALASEKLPSTSDSLAGGSETVAGNGSSLARKRVIDNSNTSGHVPQHARQLFGRFGDGGRSRVFSGRKSDLRYRGYISGHPLPLLFFR